MPMPERLVVRIGQRDGVTSKTLAAVAGEFRAAHPLETVGAKLRGMMPWIQENRLVDRSRN